MHPAATAAGTEKHVMSTSKRIRVPAPPPSGKQTRGKLRPQPDIRFESPLDRYAAFPLLTASRTVKARDSPVMSGRADDTAC